VGLDEIGSDHHTMFLYAVKPLMVFLSIFFLIFVSWFFYQKENKIMPSISRKPVVVQVSSGRECVQYAGTCRYRLTPAGVVVRRCPTGTTGLPVYYCFADKHLLNLKTLHRRKRPILEDELGDLDKLNADILHDAMRLQEGL
jgi:hypothetical protein